MSAAASCSRCIIQLHHADDASYRCCIKQLLLHCQLLHHVSCCMCQMLHQAAPAAHVSCCITKTERKLKNLARPNLDIVPYYNNQQAFARCQLLHHASAVSYSCIMQMTHHTDAASSSCCCIVSCCIMSAAAYARCYIKQLLLHHVSCCITETERKFKNLSRPNLDIVPYYNN